ncbi:MAG: hypothetical protein R6U51_06050 [Anaerolineales bacterium]
MSVSKEFFLAVLVLSLVGLVFFGWVYFVGELVLTSLLIRTAPVVKQGIRFTFSLAAGTLLMLIFLHKTPFAPGNHRLPGALDQFIHYDIHILYE